MTLEEIDQLKLAFDANDLGRVKNLMTRTRSCTTLPSAMAGTDR